MQQGGATGWMDFYKPQLPLPRHPAPETRSQLPLPEKTNPRCTDCSKVVDFRSDLLICVADGRIIENIWILKISASEKRRVDFTALK